LLFFISARITFGAIDQRGSATSATTTGTTLTIDKPSGVVEGDLLIVNITHSNTTGDPSLSGWTLIAGSDQGNYRYSAILYKIATASEGTSYSFTVPSGTYGSVGSIIAFSDVNTTSPFDVTPGSLSSGSASSYLATATGITTVSDNAAIVFIGGSNETSFNSWSGSTPTFTEIMEVDNSNRLSVAAAWGTLTTAGATGDKTVALDYIDGHYAAMLLALKPNVNASSEYDTPGSSSFTVPSGITCIQVESWGAGGGGAERSNNIGGNRYGGGGGAGGGFASGALAVSSGDNISVTVGAGGTGGSGNGNDGDDGENSSASHSSGSVTAYGGEGGQAGYNGPGGVGTSGTFTGTVNSQATQTGGDGGDGDNDNGGGGGGAAGSSADGGDGGNTAGGTGGASDGGDGGDGSTNDNAGQDGSTFGGGGGGSSDNNNSTGGDGADGQIIISWIDVSSFSTSTDATLCQNDATTVTVTSTTIADGSYVVTYNLSGTNSVTGNTVTMNFFGGTGTFETSTLANPGSTTVTISGVGFTTSCSQTVSSGNTATSSVTAGSTVSVSISDPGDIAAGAYATFTASPSNGGTAPVYEWQVNGITVGADAYKYTNLATLETGDVVNVILTSSESCTSPVTSNSVIINVLGDVDSDGDGVYDADDLDDDNDGIPDIRETTCFEQPFENGGFDENDPPGDFTYFAFPEDQVAGWETTASDGKIEIWDSGFNNVDSYEGDFHAEINGNEAAMLFQKIKVEEGDVLTWEIAHRGRDGKDSMYIYVGPVDEEPELNASVQTDNDAWKTYRGEYWVSSNVDSVFLGFKAGATASNSATVGNFIDFVSLVIVDTKICDEDGNGVADKLDLDSDNDGIYDLWEAGGIDFDTNQDGQLTSADGNWVDADNDGLFDPIDDYGGSVTDGISLGAPDTDGDGDPDYFDLDSDGDGCDDVIEAGFVDDNGDGLLGNNNAVDIEQTDWGEVLDTINGYTEPNDLDGNGIYDFQEAATAPSATVDPSDQSVSSGEDASFTSGGTGDVAIWQESIDAGNTWNDITNGGIYDGATTTTLDLTGVTLSMNSYQYRYYLKTRAYACDSIDSSAVAILTVSALPGDWDGDGIANIDDIDDDNDGIPDAIENDCAPSYPISAYDAYWSLDNTTDDQSGNGYDLRTGSVSYDSDVILGDASANFNGTSDYLSYNGSGFLTDAITYFSYSFWIKPATLTGTQCLLDEGGATNGLSIQLNGSGLECAIREGGAGSQVNITGQTVPSDGKWHHVAVVYDNGDVTLYLDNSASTTANTGFDELASHGSNHAFGVALGDAFGNGNNTNYYTGLMDEIYHYPSVLSSTDIDAMYQHGLCDADGDGVANSFDLDSDNDGIYDVVESGQLNGTTVVDLNNDGVIDGATSDFGTNGLFDDVETTDDSGTLTQNTADSDSDGLYDHEELDSDDDGCNDVDEAGYTDGDSDGLLGSSTTSENSYGKVTSGSDGYTEPNDLDINSTYDFQEAGLAASISAQPVNVTEPVNDDATFTITASAESYQWQDSTSANTWTNIVDDTLSSLTLSNVQLSMDGNKYRVIVKNKSYACDLGDTSIVVVLTVSDFSITLIPNGETACPDLDSNTNPPFNPDNSNYNSGATEITFRVMPDVTSIDWEFDFDLIGIVSPIDTSSMVTELVLDGESTTPSDPASDSAGTIDANDNEWVDLTFTIQNTPGSSQNITLFISNVVDNGNSCSSCDTNVTYTIDAMPEVGSFN
jgi:hypothetical protein